MTDIIDKRTVLAKWIKSHKHLPAQGSIKWLKGRTYRIGGSEIGTLDGVNRYSNEKALVMQKLGISKFKGNQYTRWGSMLEDVTVTVLEKIFGCKIHVPGSIPHPTIPEHANSPDGVAYVESVDEIILFEIKNPARRIPTLSTVPKQYECQVQSGLDTIPICDHAVFVDMMQRKCTLADLQVDNRSYDCEYHNAKTDRVRNDPYVLTMIGIYEPVHEYDEWKEAPIDYGAAPARQFHNMLEMWDGKMFKAHYGKVVICNQNDQAECDAIRPNKWLKEFRRFCKTENVAMVGYLPLKTFRLTMVPVTRRAGFMAALKPKIKNTIDVVRRLSKLDSSDQTIHMNCLYPTGKLDMDAYAAFVEEMEEAS